jgi:hypothetical protein
MATLPETYEIIGGHTIPAIYTCKKCWLDTSYPYAHERWHQDNDPKPDETAVQQSQTDVIARVQEWIKKEQMSIIPDMGQWNSGRLAELNRVSTELRKLTDVS